MSRFLLQTALLVVGLALTISPALAAKSKAATKAPVTRVAQQKSPAPVTPAQPASSAPPTAAPAAPTQDTFLIEPLGSNIYAAIAKIGGKASSNALIVIGDRYVIAAGAHMTKEVTQDLYAAIAALTPKPVRYFILAHHHTGYTQTDFDFPPGQDVVMAWQTWQELNNEARKPAYPVLFFSEGLTLKPGGVTVILTDLGRGHSSGDVVTYIPEAKVVFASDLFYVNSVGYMGGGYMREWVLALDFLEQLGAEKIIPGTGPVSGVEELTAFKEFFQEFLTAVLMRIERGDTLEQVLKDFDMPKYRQMSGYQQLIKVNLKRAYIELKEDFGR